jgi:hypothetical protein
VARIRSRYLGSTLKSADFIELRTVIIRPQVPHFLPREQAGVGKLYKLKTLSLFKAFKRSCGSPSPLCLVLKRVEPGLLPNHWYAGRGQVRTTVFAN